MNTRLQHESLINVSKFLTFIFFKVYKKSVSLTRNFIKKVLNMQTGRLARLFKANDPNENREVVYNDRFEVTIPNQF